MSQGQKAVSRFNKQVKNLLSDLKRIFPQRKEISIGQAQLETALMVNQRVVIDSFIKYVYPFKDQIQKKDEHFFLKPGNVGEDDYISEALQLRELWKNELRPENKDMLWKYFQVLIVLAERA